MSSAESLKPKTSKPPQSSELVEALKDYTVRLNLPEQRKKPRLLSLLFCDFANFTLDKKINLLGIFDRIYVPPNNTKTPVFTLYVRTAETVEERLIVTLFDPDGKVGMAFQFGGEQLTYTPGLPAQVQLAIGVQFAADKQGPYWFDVSYKGVSLGGAGLVVEHRSMEESHGGTDTYI